MRIPKNSNKIWVLASGHVLQAHLDFNDMVFSFAFVPTVSTIVIVTIATQVIMDSFLRLSDIPSQLTHCFYAVLNPYKMSSNDNLLYEG